VLRDSGVTSVKLDVVEPQDRKNGTGYGKGTALSDHEAFRVRRAMRGLRDLSVLVYLAIRQHRGHGRTGFAGRNRRTGCTGVIKLARQAASACHKITTSALTPGHVNRCRKRGPDGLALRDRGSRLAPT
jgi:hypothetical protein